MYFVENRLYITFPELVASGISGNTIHSARTRQSISWSFLQDPLDKRRLLVSYEGLQASYREKVIRHYGDPYEHCREQKQKQNALNTLLEVPPEEARAIKFPSEEGMPWMDAEKQQRTHTLCGYVRAYLRLKDKTIRRSFGYGTHEGAVGALLQMACEQRDDVPVTFSGLGKRVKVYGERGVEGLFPKNLRNKNALKVQAGLPQDLMGYLNSHPNNIDAEKARTLYNLAIQKVGGQEVSACTVRRWRNSMTPGVRALGTRGARALSNHHLIQHKRRRPSLPLLHWCLDGWRAELLYQDRALVEKNGKRSHRQVYGLRPYLVLVIDTHNDYPVGWALGDREDFSLIKEAIKRAIDHTKALTGSYLRPAQVQSDNFSRKQLSGLLSQLCWHRYTPAAVGNAKAKPIERVFGYLGRRYMQMLPNYKGHNLTARPEHQPNAEYKQLTKHHQPNRHAAFQQLEAVLQLYRKEKSEAYLPALQDLPREKRYELLRGEYLPLLGVPAPRTHQREGQGIGFILAHTRRWYDSTNLAFRKAGRKDWQLFYDPADLSSVCVQNEQGAQFLLEKKHEQAMALVERTEADKEALQTTIRANKRLQATIVKRLEAQRKSVEALFKEHPELAETELGWGGTTLNGGGQHKGLLHAAIEAQEAQADTTAGLPKDVQTAYMDLVMREMEHEKKDSL